MDLQALADLAELVGGIAVAISLVYLAVQVRQNTASIRTENFSRALERVSAMQSLLFENGALTRLQAQGAIGPTRLTREERLRLTWWFLEAFGAFEFMFHQARSSALPDEISERWSATIAWWASFPGVQAWWRARPTPFSKSFTSYVDALIRDGRFDPETADRFDKFLAATVTVPSTGPPAAPWRESRHLIATAIVRQCVNVRWIERCKARRIARCRWASPQKSADQPNLQNGDPAAPCL